MPLFGLYNICIALLLFIVFPLFIKNARDHWNDNRYSAISGLASGFALLASGIYLMIRSVPVFFFALGANTQELAEVALQLATEMPLPYPFSSFIFYFACFLMSFLMAYWLLEMKKGKYKEAKEEEKLNVDPLDIEVSRKLFHICIIGVMVCYLFVGRLVMEGTFDTMYKLYEYYFAGKQAYYTSLIVLNNRIMGQGITIFIFIIIFQILFFTDIIRIYRYRYYPLKELSFVYRNKERNVFGPHVFLLAGSLFAVLLFPGPIAISAIAIAGFGDAMATIVGVSVGRRKIKPLGHESSKTWEGCLGGIIGSFIFGFLSYFFVATVWFEGLGITWDQILISGIIINLVGAGVFFISDYFTPPMKISDNIFNPIFIPLAEFIVCLIIFPGLIIY